jgi:hypothetical protein
MVRRLTSERGLAILLSTFAVLMAAYAVALALAFNASSDAVSGIQASRRDNCVQQNQRHDATIAQLDHEIALLPPRMRVRAVANRAFTVALIDALSPVRDCKRMFPQ